LIVFCVKKEKDGDGVVVVDVGSRKRRRPRIKSFQKKVVVAWLRGARGGG